MPTMSSCTLDQSMSFDSSMNDDMNDTLEQDKSKLNYSINDVNNNGTFFNSRFESRA